MKIRSVALAGLALLVSMSSIYAHCQVPCGVYGDKMRIDMIREHLQTIEKAMTQINELSASGEKNYNQLVRWINTKEQHAQEIQDITTAYWLTQRIKPAGMSDKEAYSKYLNNCATLHQMLVYAMKCKQTTDAANVEKLDKLLDAFYQSYFGEEDKAHLEEHHK